MIHTKRAILFSFSFTLILLTRIDFHWIGYSAWTEVASSLDFIENWDDAKNLFENFKKRYLQKRNVQYTTFPSHFLASSLLSVKTTRLKIYIVSMPAGLNSTDKRSRARAL